MEFSLSERAGAAGSVLTTCKLCTPAPRTPVLPCPAGRELSSQGRRGRTPFPELREVPSCRANRPALPRPATASFRTRDVIKRRKCETVGPTDSAKCARAWVSALLFEIRAWVFVNRPQIPAWHHRTCLRTPRAPVLSAQECSDRSGRRRPSQCPQPETRGQLITPGSNLIQFLVYHLHVHINDHPRPLANFPRVSCHQQQ